MLQVRFVSVVQHRQAVASDAEPGFQPQQLRAVPGSIRSLAQLRVTGGREGVIRTALRINVTQRRDGVAVMSSGELCARKVKPEAAAGGRG